MANWHIADSARLIGTIRVGDRCIVAQGAVLRSTDDSLSLGNHSMVLENSVLIGTPRHPLRVGSKTVFGHKCIAIGTRIGDLCEIGNGTIFLPGSKIGSRCIFGEGTIVPENTIIPDDSVVVGRPAKIIRSLTEKDKTMIARMRSNDMALSSVTETVLENEAKEGKTMGKLYPYGSAYPNISDSATLFDSAELTGDVSVGDNSVIAAGVKIIGDSHGPVRIGSNVQILENTVLHLLPDNDLIIEDNVTIGPGCIIHGTTIGAGSVIESGAILCDYSKVGQNTLVKSGSLVKQRSSFDDHQILEGFPAVSIGVNTKPLTRPDWAIRK